MITNLKPIYYNYTLVSNICIKHEKFFNIITNITPKICIVHIFSQSRRLSLLQKLEPFEIHIEGLQSKLNPQLRASGINVILAIPI